MGRSNVILYNRGGQHATAAAEAELREVGNKDFSVVISTCCSTDYLTVVYKAVVKYGGSGGISLMALWPLRTSEGNSERRWKKGNRTGRARTFEEGEITLATLPEKRLNK